MGERRGLPPPPPPPPRLPPPSASFFSEQLRELGLPITGEHAHPHEDDDYDPFAPRHAAGPPRADGAVSVGVVQIAYANGASSRYIRESLGLLISLRASTSASMSRCVRGSQVQLLLLFLRRAGQWPRHGSFSRGFLEVVFRVEKSGPLCPTA